MLIFSSTVFTDIYNYSSLFQIYGFWTKFWDYFWMTLIYSYNSQYTVYYNIRHTSLTSQLYISAGNFIYALRVLHTSE